MKLARNKTLALGFLLSLLGALLYLHEESSDANPRSDNISVNEVTPDDRGKRETSAGQLDAMTPEEKREFYEVLYREKGNRDVVRQGLFQLKDMYSLLDEGLVNADPAIRFYAVAILRQYAISRSNDVKSYISGESTRVRMFITLLESEASNIAEGAFIVLASTRLNDSAVAAKLIDIVNARRDDDNSKLEMIRELGRHRNEHSEQIKRALTDLVLDYEVGAPSAAPMLDAALILSRYERDRPDAIFPHICKAYEASLYESSIMLHILERYAEFGIGCVEEMSRVADKMKRNEIKMRQPSQAKWYIDKTQQVIDKLRVTASRY